MKIHDPKRKNLSLFQSKLHSITVSSVIEYILEVHSTSSSLKKKKSLKRERGKENEMEKREEKERGGKEVKKKKGMERVCG